MRIGSLPVTSEMTNEQKQVWTACQQLEQVFLEILLQQMHQGGGKNGLLPDTFQGGVYRDMQRQALAEQMAKSGGIGLASTLYRQLQQQEVLLTKQSSKAATPVIE